jgi:hypothetical protein
MTLDDLQTILSVLSNEESQHAELYKRAKVKLIVEASMQECQLAVPLAIFELQPSDWQSLFHPAHQCQTRTKGQMGP